MPVALTLDVATKIIEPTQSIWAVFPGLARRFYNDFRDNDVIFLDTPAISLTERSLNDRPLLRRHVAMTLAWRDYLRGRSEEIPSRDVDSYDYKTDPSFGAAVGNVTNMFIRMKTGDLVLVGQYDIYEPILIGEINRPFHVRDVIDHPRFPTEQTPVRHIRWVSADQERRFLSKDLSKRLSNRKAITSVDPERFGDEIYRMAYWDYVNGETSRYIFNGRDYKNIATATIPGIRLITYFCAAFKAAELERLDDFFSLTISVGIEKYFDEDIFNSFEIDFKSPGEYILSAKRAAMAVTVALLVSVASGDSTVTAARQAQLVNSETGPSPTEHDVAACPIPIEEKYRAILNSMHADRYNELCVLNSRAQNGVGLSVKVKKHLEHTR